LTLIHTPWLDWYLNSGKYKKRESAKEAHDYQDLFAQRQYKEKIT